MTTYYTLCQILPILLMINYYIQKQQWFLHSEMNAVSKIVSNAQKEEFAFLKVYSIAVWEVSSKIS